ncbi:MAG: hypothetical protein U0W24_04590 [Bacteroidales bacterium]
MKKIIFTLLLTGTLFSCSDEFNYYLGRYPQKWQLVKMKGELPNSERTGADMDWQEFYLLKSDGTFTKQREEDGIQTEAHGTFTLTNNEIELVYDTNCLIIGSCSGNQTESLLIKSSVKLVGTWSYCDGPELEYKRVE